MHDEDDDARDELDETIAEYTAKHPEFPSLFAAAKQRRALERSQRTRRGRPGLPDEGVAPRASAAHTPRARAAEGPTRAREARSLTVGEDGR